MKIKEILRYRIDIKMQKEYSLSFYRKFMNFKK